MEDSILKSTKQILGLTEDDESFDLDILTFINTALATLEQVGLPPTYIEDETTKWVDLGVSANVLNLVRSFVILKVRMLWDPSGLSFVISMQEKQLDELLWRINSAKETEGVV